MSIPKQYLIDTNAWANPIQNISCLYPMSWIYIGSLLNACQSDIDSISFRTSDMHIDGDISTIAKWHKRFGKCDIKYSIPIRCRQLVSKRFWKSDGNSIFIQHLTDVECQLQVDIPQRWYSDIWSISKWYWRLGKSDKIFVRYRVDIFVHRYHHEYYGVSVLLIYL